LSSNRLTRSPPRYSPRASPSPYTTLFRSPVRLAAGEVERQEDVLPGGQHRQHVEPLEDEPDPRATEIRERVVGQLGEFDARDVRSEEHTSELQSRFDLVCRLLLEKKKAHT